MNIEKTIDQNVTQTPIIEDTVKTSNRNIFSIVIGTFLVAFCLGVASLHFFNTFYTQPTRQVTPIQKTSDYQNDSADTSNIVVAESTSTDSVSTEKWVKKVYSSNDQVLWNIEQPVETTANENGLIEGHLELTSNWEGSSFTANFGFPIFEDSMPANIDEWAKNYFDPNSYGTEKMVITKADKSGIPIRVISNVVAYMDGDKTGKGQPASFILIWSHPSKTGVNINPSVISINQTTGVEGHIDDYTKNMITGLQL